MRIERQETFQGIENNFPDEMKTPIREVVRRIESEIDSLVRRLQNPWAVTGDTEAVLFDPRGPRLYITLPDGTKEFITVDFGQDTATVGI